MISNQSPFVQDTTSVSYIMFLVLVALLPGILVHCFLFGYGILFNIITATITVLIAEYLILKARNYPVKPFLKDYSAIVTAWLLAVSIPSIAPWWIIVIGSLFSIIFAKHFYGGLGSNLFNPAMVGYAILLISFPAIMTKWPSAYLSLSFSEQLKLFFYGMSNYDAIASATPLDYLKTELLLNKNSDQILAEPIIKANPLIWVGVAYLLGGLFLIYKKIITWHLPLTYLLTLFLIASLFSLANPNNFAPFHYHLLNGGTFLAAFFIITDPVSGPTTPKGKIFFAFMVAMLVYLIRIFGGYPEGIAFAVIFMNICVPLIDKLSQPKVFGHE